MAARPMLRSLSRAPPLLRHLFNSREIFRKPGPISSLVWSSYQNQIVECNCFRQLRSITHGSVSLVISPQGFPKFEAEEIDPPKKEKWMTKKRLKLKRKKEKQKRKSANRKDPRKLGITGRKKGKKFDSSEARILYKLEKARIKEAALIERLKRYEVPKAQGPVVEPHFLTGEERFYMKKMAQKRSNYVPVGRRGVFGGVILNMHMHWKKHETVKVICKPCKPGQIQEYAEEIARLSGGVPIQVIGNDAVVFYRGKDYVQPKVMSPVDTLSKKRALEKSKYKQSLESVRRFIALAEKELELYYRHVALYGDPNDRDPKSLLDHPETKNLPNVDISAETGAASSSGQEFSESSSDLDCEDDGMFTEAEISSDESTEQREAGWNLRSDYQDNFNGK